MLAKRKEKDVIDQLLDQIDFHGMTAEELAGENGLLKKLTSRFYLHQNIDKSYIWPIQGNYRSNTKAVV